MVVALLVVWLWPVSPVMMLCNSSFCGVVFGVFCELYCILDGHYLDS